MHETDDAIARFDTVHFAPTAMTSPATFATQLHRHGKGSATVDAAMVSGGLAVELMNLAGAVLDIPARHRCGDHFHQHIVDADIGFRVIAENELVRPTEFKQADGFHRIWPSLLDVSG